MSTVTTRRVFVLEPLRGEDDVKSLKRHGEPKLIFDGIRAPNVFSTEAYEDAITAWMRNEDYDPYHDAFVVTGRLTKVALALGIICRHVAYAHPGQSVRVLIYDGHIQDYVERFI